MEMESPSPYLQCSAVQCYSTPSSIRIPSLRSVLLRLPVIVERRMQGANKRLVSRLEHKGARHQNHKRRRKRVNAACVSPRSQPRSPKLEQLQQAVGSL